MFPIPIQYKVLVLLGTCYKICITKREFHTTRYSQVLIKPTIICTYVDDVLFVIQYLSGRIQAPCIALYTFPHTVLARFALSFC